MERGLKESDNYAQRLDPGIDSCSRGDAETLQDGLGNFPEDAHRFGGGSRCLYLSEPEFESVYSGTDTCEAYLYALLRLEEGTQNGHLLSENKGTSYGTAIYS